MKGGGAGGGGMRGRVRGGEVERERDEGGGQALGMRG